MKHTDERFQAIREIVWSTATKDYGIKEYDRARITELMSTIDVLKNSSYKIEEIREGFELACQQSPKFFPRLNEIKISIKNALKYMRRGDESESKDREYEQAKEQTARRNKQRAWVESNFSSEEVSKAINLWCAKEKIPRNWGSDLEFFSAVAEKGSYARNLLQEMLEAKKNENAKCKGEGQKTTTVGEKETN